MWYCNGYLFGKTGKGHRERREADIQKAAGEERESLQLHSEFNPPTSSILSNVHPSSGYHSTDMFSVTPNQFKKVGMGLAPSPSPFLTPRPERRRLDSRGTELKSSRQDRDGEVNVQVILRCRPLGDDEQKISIPKVITCNEPKREVNVSQSIANKQVDRVFTFDKVFGPRAQQRSIYDQAISPVVDEVLDGYNCTVFAYGQTGTGKTYTMEGEMRSKGGELPAEAGVIPRAVRQIFDTLEAQNADYSVKATFLELYNEEVTDLLALEDTSRLMDDKQKRSVSLLEDGKGCVFIRGLEEEVVYSVNDIYNLLERGAAKRRTADTFLNKRSSRSHSIFTITVHIKETSIGDEELIKCGKLNLVDLAGSENISRSGAREGRAREAGEINKSLLTLGRVINALVEHSVHIPYRDSKLTRLLRDSLGGKTKTCIIATISPSSHCLEETLSTLDYAHRAKNIKNRPEANQKMSKTVLLKELYIEIERMKQDVRAAREKNGIYIPHENFALEEAEKKAKNERLEQLEIDLSVSAKEVDKYRELYIFEQEQKLDMESELKDCKVNVQITNRALQDLQENHRQTILELREKELIISKLLRSENSLIEHAKHMRSNLENAAGDINALHANIDEKDKLNAQNHQLLLTFGSHLDQSLTELHKTFLVSVSQQQNQVRCIEEQLSSFLARKADVKKDLESKIKKVTETYASGAMALRELAKTLQQKASMDLEQMNSAISSQTTALEKFLESAHLEAQEVICTIQNSLCQQEQLLEYSAEQQEKGLERTLVSAQIISKQTIGFFDNLYNHVSKLMANVKESQDRNYHHLINVEKIFKEQSAEEEKQAVEKITAILAGLTTKKTAMVSEALRTISNARTQENKLVLQELSNMQQVSTNGRAAMNGHSEEVERYFLESSHLLTQTRATMQEHVKECSVRVDSSMKQWENAQHSISNLLHSGSLAVQSIMNTKISENETAFDQNISTSYSKDLEFDAGTRALVATINDSLMVDCQTKKEIDSSLILCINELKASRYKHSESMSSIRTKAQQCITKEYLVDQSEAPEKRVIAVPSLESIEKMRTMNFDVILERRGSENMLNNGKIQLQQQLPHTPAVSPNRTPFGFVN
ncbi:hypothetical protein Ancab_031999 [Ancistrocladus abbreviatus]